jgi:NADPH-dependent curcumin reductase CurA
LFEIAKLQPGERVFVSAAAGAVGSMVCQIAKSIGCFVVGSAGSDEKCAWLKDVAGIDEVINYRTTDDLSAAVRTAFPDGIDVYFENVGGEHFVAALANMAEKDGSPDAE